ncbi:MAG: tetratricopeptide repeat protein [Deltaproteobacteria bacterium]|nr:tetratricopeptide repeat protein [Deltaproteobacteria bacterium]
MATQKTAAKVPDETPDWRGRQGFLPYLRDVVIAAVILGSGLFLYYRHEATGRKVRELGKQAKEYIVKDSPQGYVEAEKRLQEMVALDSDFPFALASLGELYAVRWLDHGLEADAANARKWAQEADKTDAKINERFGAVVLVMLGEKKYEQAEKYASEITRKAASSHVVNGYGRALRGQGKLDEARQALKKSADTEWRNPRFACDFADLFFEDGDFVNAQAFYAKGIEANSDHLRSLIGRSRSQIARGWKIKEASETLADVLGRPAEQLSPRLRAQALTALSELRGFEQKFDEAVKHADEAIAVSPSFSWAHFAKGRALAMLKNVGAAAEFDKALELDRFVPEFYYNGSTAMLEAGDPAKAQALLDAYLKAPMREDDRFHLAYGNLMLRIAKPEEALAHYDKAITHNGFNAVAHYAKGAALFDARKTFLTDPKDTKKEAELMDNSKKELELALEVQEYFPAAYTKLGDILFEKKEWGDGCQQYAQALMQMKQLQAPRERMTELRERINERLLKEAKLRDVAKAWMDETGKLIR